MRSIGVAILLACSVFAASLLCETSQEARAQVSRPNPSPTAKYDTGVLGIPQPSPVPSCVTGVAFTFADAAGCIYACSGGKVVNLTTAFGSACAVPTTGATPTVTATVTATP